MLSKELKRLRLPLLIIVLCVLPTLVHAYDYSGWVWRSDEDSHFAYSVDEDDLLYIQDPAWFYNFTTGQWDYNWRPKDWYYVDWPFYYVLDTDTVWFVLPDVPIIPELSFLVYHYSTEEIEPMPRILP